MPALDKHQGDDLDFERKLLGRLRLGDVEALGLLYDIHIDYLLDFGIYYVNDTGELEDHIHDLFLNLFKSRSKAMEIRNVRTYLAVALKRKLFKKKVSKECMMEEDRFLHLLNSSPDGIEVSPEKKWIETEQVESLTSELKLAMRSLTKHQKHIIQLRFVENLSFAEIAQTLDVSKTSARTLLYRTLKALRKEF
ncbi:sigma-70 family RNA polymerase sigma factor [Flagellimonas marinaquae]|uniref:RNA polymerase sigma factor n=1 Tax=Flagellimonas aurea TaxID=2915619 RepID=UPI001CE0F133|nr:sigma-70 family RNA polymerase sigma factor [Allomuricauda aquimarina]